MFFFYFYLLSVKSYNITYATSKLNSPSAKTRDTNSSHATVYSDGFEKSKTSGSQMKTWTI